MSLKHIILFASIFVFFECNDNKENISFQKLSKAKLHIVDSIAFNADTLFFHHYIINDIENDAILALDENSEIYRLDFNSKGIQKIGKKGKAPGEYIDPVGAYYHNKDSIFISERVTGKVFLYNSAGLFLKSWEVASKDDKNFLPSFMNYFRVIKNKKEFIFEYIGRSGRKYDITNPKYYNEAMYLSVFNIESNKAVHYMPLEKGSPYLGKYYFLSPLDPALGYSQYGYYTLIFAHEDVIYLYDKNKKLLRKIDGKSSYFPIAKGVPFEQKDKSFGKNYVKYNVKMNALNYNSSALFAQNGKIFICKQYEAPVLDDRLPEDLNTLKTTYYKRDSYLQLYDLNGVKQYEDILQPRKLKKLIYAKNKNFMLFQAEEKLTEKNILYVAKITE